MTQTVNESVKLLFAFALGVREHRKLCHILSCQLRKGNTKQAQGHFSIPKVIKQTASYLVNFGGDVCCVREMLLMRAIAKGGVANGNRYAGGSLSIVSHTRGATVGKGEENRVSLFGGCQIGCERCRVSIALGFLRFGKYGGGINAICKAVQMLTHFHTKYRSQICDVDCGKLTNGANVHTVKSFCRRATKRKERIYRQGPHL